MANSDVSRWWIASEGFLALSLVALPLGLGGAPEWSLWLLAALSSGAAIAWCGGAAGSGHEDILVPGPGR